MPRSESMARSESMKSIRAFFSLLPDAETRRRMATINDNIPVAAGRKVAEENLHLTLLFLGNVPQEDLDGLRQACADISAKAFNLIIAEAGLWPKSKILWLGPENPPKSMNQLAIDLSHLAVDRGLLDKPAKFRPHITLRRGVDEGWSIPSFDSFRWQVNEFCLMQSVTHPSGPVYTMLDSWKLKR